MTCEQEKACQATSTANATRMLLEAGEAGIAVARLVESNAAMLQVLGPRLREMRPSILVTCARGSSDHAATYAKYLVETLLGVPTLSAAFSTVSLFDAPETSVGNPRTICLAISQSGRSPDLLATVQRQREAGALTIALVNDESAPLADIADVVLPLAAGPEISVAATKSYICSLAGIAALVSAWGDDTALASGVAALPAQLDHAFTLDWSAVIPELAQATNLFTIGRGYSLAIARKPRSSSRKRAACTGKPSVRRKRVMARWRLFAMAFPSWPSRQTMPPATMCGPCARSLPDAARKFGWQMHRAGRISLASFAYPRSRRGLNSRRY